MEPTLKTVQELFKEGEFQRIPVKRELFADHLTPIEAMRALRAASNHCFLLESAQPDEKRGRYTFLGLQPTLEFTCMQGRARTRYNVETNHETEETTTTENPANLIRDIMNNHKSPRLEGFPPFSGGLVGYFSFDYLSYSEPKLRQQPFGDFSNTQEATSSTGSDSTRTKPLLLDFLDVDLMLFNSVIVFDSFRQKVLLITGVQPSKTSDTNFETDANEAIAKAYNEAEKELDRIEAILLGDNRYPFEALHLESNLEPRFNENEYESMVNQAKHYIAEGDIFQVVLSNPLTAPASGSLFDTYRILRSENPSPYMLYFTSDDVEIAGASPETLVRLENNQLQTFPLAGTRPRGATPEEDKRIQEELTQDEKELAEHNMLVDLGRNDLGRVCQLGSVCVDTYLDVLKFSRVMHIGSTVSGTIAPEKDALGAIDAVLPAGTLSGAPKIRAVEIIHELEQTTRGIYGGALGYLDFSGNMDMCIAIRLAYKKNNIVCVQSGAGIVADSNPASEYLECQNKAAAVVSALTTANGGL